MAFSGENRDESGNGGEETNRSRRGVLATGGIVIATAIGIPIGSADEHTDEFDEDEILTLFEVVLEDQDVEVAELVVEEDPELDAEVLLLEYYPLGLTEEEIVEEMGYITGAFAEAVEMGLEVERLHAIALDLTDTPISQWYVETEWAEAYNAGEISANELAMEAFLTLEPIEEADSI